ncbi:MAG: type 11 methyltransferase [Hyphomicrobiales bacterium]|nr:type 11 methyltransferase [Hyphomicrobiales bacterium]
MSELKWTTSHTVNVLGYDIPSVEVLPDGFNQGNTIVINTQVMRALKYFLYPLHSLKADLLMGGFIKRHTGILIERYLDAETVFLDAGCGDMALRRFLPRTTAYNAIDLFLKDFHIQRAKRSGNANILHASLTDIPLESNSVNLIASTEVFEHIPDVGKAIQELHRISMNGGMLVGSIPNNYCYKYDKKGKHPAHCNDWTWAEFLDFMTRNGFSLVHSHMVGRWLDLPMWLTKQSYQLPFSQAKEYHNTNFIFAFKVVK